LARKFHTWPTMEEEILVIEKGEEVVFNFPAEFFRRYVSGVVNMIKPEKVFESIDEQGGRRVILIVKGEAALELRAWLSIKVGEDGNYYVTDFQEIG